MLKKKIVENYNFTKLVTYNKSGCEHDCHKTNKVRQKHSDQSVSLPPQRVAENYYCHKPSKVRQKWLRTTTVAKLLTTTNVAENCNCYQTSNV